MAVGTRLVKMAPLGALLVLGAGLAGAAENDQALRRISFRVESAREVQNDWLSASVAVTDEGTDPAALAQRINQTMDWALRKARAEKRVQVESGGYHTQPIYDKGRIRGWRATQRLRIEGRDFEAATALLGELQGRLQLESLAFTVSPERRQELEAELVQAVLAAFRSRADLVRKSLGASSYEIVQLGIDTPGAFPPPHPMVRAEMVHAAAVAPVAAEGGATRIAVQVHATIELD